MSIEPPVGPFVVLICAARARAASPDSVFADESCFYDLLSNLMAILDNFLLIYIDL